MLTDQDTAILALEARHIQSAGVKEEQIRQLFGWHAARYYQRLNDIIDMPAALEAQPMLVKALLNAREHQLIERASRHF